LLRHIQNGGSAWCSERGGPSLRVRVVKRFGKRGCRKIGVTYHDKMFYLNWFGVANRMSFVLSQPESKPND
jgi:hypothetical protein